MVFRGGVCMVFSRGHVRFFQGKGACVVFSGGHACFFPGVGGMCGFFWGACVVFLGGVHGFFRGADMLFSGGACIGYDEIRSMSGRYTSYWNAFLFNK